MSKIHLHKIFYTTGCLFFFLFIFLYHLFFDFFYGFQRKAGTFGYVFHRKAHGKQAESSLIQTRQSTFCATFRATFRTSFCAPFFAALGQASVQGFF